MGTLDSDLIAEFNRSRNIANPTYLCHAPFSNIYFNVVGQAAACWQTFANAPRYPEKTIREIWFGEYFEKLRNQLRNNDLSQCIVCEKNIRNKLFKNALAAAYDTQAPLQAYPSIMEFELSNRCNLGCVMCNGRLSSTVRKIRDELPACDSPYDERFVDQLEEFIPHLKEARFNGGEPFLQDLCWSAWERIIRINDQVEITVATNGTVWSDRVRELLERGKFRINLSLDGMSQETYEAIRIRSKFDRVIENVHRFGKYCREKGTIFSIMINPMRPNWRELPASVDFCNRNGYHLWFNTVYRPFELALWTLSSEQLVEIHRELSEKEFDTRTGPSVVISDSNVRKYRNLVDGQVFTWIKEQWEREKSRNDYSARQKSKAQAKEELKTRLSGKLADPGVFELAWSKLETLESRVSRNVSATDLYHGLLQLPLDAVQHDLRSKSVEQMTEEAYYRAEYY